MKYKAQSFYDGVETLIIWASVHNIIIMPDKCTNEKFDVSYLPIPELQ